MPGAAEGPNMRRSVVLGLGKTLGTVLGTVRLDWPVHFGVGHRKPLILSAGGGNRTHTGLVGPQDFKSEPLAEVLSESAIFLNEMQRNLVGDGSGCVSFGGVRAHRWAQSNAHKCHARTPTIPLRKKTLAKWAPVGIQKDLAS